MFLELKETLWLVLLYLGTVSLQTRTEFENRSKASPIVVNYVIFKSENKLCNKLCFNDLIPQIRTSGLVYKFQCGLCNQSYYRECVRFFTFNQSF